MQRSSDKSECIQRKGKMSQKNKLNEYNFIVCLLKQKKKKQIEKNGTLKTKLKYPIFTHGIVKREVYAMVWNERKKKECPKLRCSQPNQTKRKNTQSEY